MPRKRQENRGGSREGKAGKAYDNRSDLSQAPKAIPGGEYGSGARQIEAQRSAPLPAAPSPGAPQPSPGMAGADIMAMVQSLPGLGDPTQRPGEPLTAGLAGGPGVGPEGLVAGPQPNNGRSLIQAMLRENPTPELFALLADMG